VTDTTRIDEIVDTISAVAAAHLPFVKSVAGVGTGKVTIGNGGVMAGQLVPAYKGEPSEPWQHVTNLPSGRATYRTATVTEVNWDVPFRLYVDAKDEETLRRQMAVVYAGYLTVFAKHLQLDGRMPSGAIAQLTLTFGSDANWAWLEGHLPLVERLNLENVA